MNALKPRPPFQVLVMSEESRLGREAIETAYALKQLVTAGVRVFFYLEDRERTLDSPTDKIMLSLTAFADELEREKARQRTYDAMLRKARAGHVTGGPRVRLRQRRRPRRGRASGRTSSAGSTTTKPPSCGASSTLCAAGMGCARSRSAERGARAGAARAAGPAVRLGAVIGPRGALSGALPRRHRLEPDAEAQRLGPRARSVKAATDWITIEAPQLRIVSEAHWLAAHGRLEHTRQTYFRGTHGHLWGRPADGHESKYLLTGLSRCGLCGGTLIVRSRGACRRGIAGASTSTPARRSITAARRSAPTRWRCACRMRRTPC